MRTTAKHKVSKQSWQEKRLPKHLGGSNGIKRLWRKVTGWKQRWFTGFDVFELRFSLCVVLGGMFFWLYIVALSRPFCVWDLRRIFLCFTSCKLFKPHSCSFLPSFWTRKIQVFWWSPTFCRNPVWMLGICDADLTLGLKRSETTERCADYGRFNFVCFISWWRYWIYWCEGMQSSICFEYHVSSICICTIK